MPETEGCISYPGIFAGAGVTGFFTGKKPGAEKSSIAALLGVKEERVFFPVQKHTDSVACFEDEDPDNPSEADAVVCHSGGVVVGVQVADCTPILLFDRRTQATGAVHAGWRGTASGILKKAVGKMAELYGTKPPDVLVAIGPAIRWCCYEVGRDVLDRVIAQTGEGDYHRIKDGKLCLDLPSANRVQAMGLGIPAANIWLSEECTFCLPEKYFSYRRDGGPTGRQGGFIGMVKR